MKILHLNFNDNSGGAAKAVYKLHDGFIKNGIESKILVFNKTLNNSLIIPLSFKFKRYLPLIDFSPLFFYRKKTGASWGNAWFSYGINKQIKNINADIVQLNWISAGYMSLSDIKRIKKPLVWRLSDSWSITGGCHVPYNCDKFKINCGSCPQLGSKCKKDLSYFNLKRKKKIFKDLELTIVSPSIWLANLVKESGMFPKANIINIPTGVDIKLFKSKNKNEIREKLNLPLNKKIVLFGANFATSDYNKGFHLLEQLFNKFSKNEVEFIIFGSSKNTINNIRFIDYIESPEVLSDYYSAADVFVLPSLLENLSNSMIEACACGTPVVAFNSGGNAEIIEHKKNGYLVEPNSISDLFNGITWTYNNYDILTENARNKAVNKFNIISVVDAYINLYNNIINKNG